MIQLDPLYREVSEYERKGIAFDCVVVGEDDMQHLMWALNIDHPGLGSVELWNTRLFVEQRIPIGVSLLANVTGEGEDREFKVLGYLDFSSTDIPVEEAKSVSPYKGLHIVPQRPGSLSDTNRVVEATHS